jgi:putative ABC transport system permease protein
MQKRQLNRWLLTRLAAQNVSRRKVRVVLLALSVALAVGVGLASVVLGYSVHDSIASSFSRMGADLVVVPQNTLLNLTSSLLTVQPTEETVDEGEGRRLSRIAGVSRVAPQRIVSAVVEGDRVNLIAIDPKTDFTVRNWLDERKAGVLKDSDIIAGNSMPGQVGESLLVCGSSMHVAGRLEKTGVGPFDESYFVTFAALKQLAQRQNYGGSVASLHNTSLYEHGAHSTMDHDMAGTTSHSCLDTYQPGRVTAFLLQLSSGARIEQVKFSISRNPLVKVVEGNNVVISSRQGLRTMLIGVAIFTLLLFTALLILVGLLFSAIVQERYREMGLLRAMGAKSRQVLAMILAEAAMTTSLGGIGGILLGTTMLLLVSRSLVYYIDRLGVSFEWPSLVFLVVASLGLLLFSAALGLAGAIIPAWKVRRIDPLALIQGGGR